MKKILSLAIFVTSISLASAAGFSGGDQFTAQLIEGRLSVQCISNPSGSVYGTAYCRADTLSPGEYSYFIGPKNGADHVTLRATHEDGSMSKTKTEAYNNDKAKSRRPFNLWISSVFQRPLLDYGQNIVKYIMTKDGTNIDQGTFIVNVVDGGRALCQRMGIYFSTSSLECENPELLCPRYFNDNNYCQ